MSIILSIADKIRRKSRGYPSDVREDIYQAAKESYWRGIVESMNMETKLTEKIIDNLCEEFRRDSFIGRRTISKGHVETVMMRMCFDKDFAIPFLTNDQLVNVLKRVAGFFTSKGFVATFEYGKLGNIMAVEISLNKHDME